MDYTFSFKDVDELEFKLSESNSKYEYNGKIVPRVTSVISTMIHEDGLMYWSNKLGFNHKSYKQVMNEALDYGTKTHHGIEIFLKENRIEETAPYFSITAFIQWWNNLVSNNIVQVIGQEVPVVCEYYGGTYDLLLSINGELWLIDFKTSNHITYKYFLQLAAYNRVLRDEQHMNLRGVCILQLSKTNPSFNEYALNFLNPFHKDYIDNSERTFMSLLYAYYHINYMEGEFKHVLEKEPTK
jgi:hypothetical protein